MFDLLVGMRCLCFMVEHGLWPEVLDELDVLVRAGQGKGWGIGFRCNANMLVHSM